jgi:hypothetical protein
LVIAKSRVLAANSLKRTISGLNGGNKSMSKVTIQSFALGRKGFQGLAGFALAAALLPVGVKAAATDSAVVDDFESASNQNKFLGYSFYYNDAKDGGNTVIKSAVAGVGTELKFDPILSIGEGASGSLKAAKLDFTFGATKPSCGGTCTYGPMAGFGTGFVAEGKVIDMTGATSITFMAKASVAMTMRVEIATSTVTNFGYHLASVPLATGYTLVTIALTEGIGGVAQPSWAAAAPNTPVVFDPSKIQKIQFAISQDDNLGLLAGTVFIDNIVVHGYKWVPPNACMTCPGNGTGALLSDMEKAPANQNAVGGYWYAYNDAEGRTVAGQADYSEIFKGVTPDSLAPTTPKISISAGKGADASAGAYIAFKLGPQYTKVGSTEAIKPFVGIGTKVSDALLTKFSNFGTATGISFSYSTDVGSTFDYIRLEAKSNRVYSNPGIVHAALLPTTNGLWVSVVVPWAKLLLPDWQEVALIPAAEQTLKLTEMEKFQWAVQGNPGTTGGFAVDNVKIEGMVAPLPVLGGVGAVFGTAAKAGKGFSVAQGLHGVQVALRLNQTEKNATIRLIDMKGNIVATQAVSGNGLQTAELGKANLPSGVYSVQVNIGNRPLPAVPVTILP